MKKYLITNYYSDKNPERRKELLYCVQKNLELNFIDNLIIFIEKESDKADLTNLINNNKIIYYNLNNSNFILKKVFKYTQEKLPEECIIIICNLDVFLEDNEHWNNVEQDFFNTGYPDKALVCTRENLYAEKLSEWQIETEKKSIDEGDFSDAWILKKPFKKKFLEENFNFTMLGSPGPDPLLMGLMSKHYHTYSWGNKYKIFHYDVCRKASKNKSTHYYHVHINNRTDVRPLMRSDEAVKIPINQDWENILKNKIQPKFIPVKNNENIFKKHLRKLYILLILSYKKLMYKIQKK